MLLNCGVGEDSWESLGLQGDASSPHIGRSVLSVHWKDWWWSWNSNTLATWCEESTHWKRPCCWERLKAGGEGDDRGWDGWMASPAWWTWVSASPGSWWWTGRPGMLQSMGLQRVWYNWVIELTDVAVVWSLSHVLTLCGLMDYSLPGSSVHGISQARTLEWVDIPFSRGFPDPGLEPESPHWQADLLPLSH